ncbi:MAG: amidohydrolase/deacetylase family metallohydrolase, partial [Byssovorax sp.]
MIRPAHALAALSLALGAAASSGCSKPRAADAVAYDLVIQGGRVIDPGSGRDGIFDVAVAGGRIARVAPRIDASRAARVVDARNLLVTPGFVDAHTHVFFGTEGSHLANGYDAAWPDSFAPRSCTTTVVDAGSSGHASYETFARQTIARSRTRVLAFLDIGGGGMRGGSFEQDLADMDARATAEMIRAHPDRIVGVKVAHYEGAEWDPVTRAVEAASATGTRVMVDFGAHVPELSLEHLLLDVLRPGDIFTHVYADVPGRTPIVDAAGLLRPFVRAARRRGILFDLGHGAGSFSFDQATAALAQAFAPDAISTDSHARSLGGAMQDLPAVLSKLGHLGVSLPELIRGVTTGAAALIGRPELGRLAEGAEADIAILQATSGQLGFTDTGDRRIDGTTRYA